MSGAAIEGKLQVSMLEAALFYAQQGIPIFPCSPETKHPLIATGFHAASADIDQLRAWWTQWPDAMIGMPTGPRSGCFVIDPDAPEKPGDPDGLEAWKQELERQEPVATRKHATPGGGQHILLRWDPQRPIRNRAGQLPAGIHVRGDGGYIIVPPSMRVDGRSYEVIDQAPIAESPAWLMALLEPKPLPERGASLVEAWPTGHERYAMAAFEAEIATVVAAAPGTRNNTLNDAAFVLGTLVVVGALDEADTRAGLREAAAACGLSEAEAEATIESGISAGMRNPRPPPPPQDVVGDAFGHVVRIEAEPHIATARGGISATPFVWIDPKTFPRRDWLFGHHLIRKFVSCTVAPGGLGKTSLLLAEGISMATGRNLTGTPCRKGPLRVWIVNLEDPREEIQRRVLAICAHFDIDPVELEGRLFIDSGREVDLVLVAATRNGVEIATSTVQDLAAEILVREIDVLIVDPLVKAHSVPENDNAGIDKVVTTFARIADLTGCAVELVHHVRKTGGAEATVEDSRGASALLAGVRSARVLNGMTKEEAGKAGGLNPRAYFRVTNGKANLAPSPDQSDWFRIHSVALGNGDPSDPLDPGDSVGVVEPWAWPQVSVDALTDDLRSSIQELIARGEWRADVQCSNWAGLAIAEALGLTELDTAERAHAKKMLEICIAIGALQIVRRKDRKRKLRDFIEVGSQAAPPSKGGAS